MDQADLLLPWLENITDGLDCESIVELSAASKSVQQSSADFLRSWRMGHEANLWIGANFQRPPFNCPK
jgi:hypothetical protein